MHKIKTIRSNMGANPQHITIFASNSSKTISLSLEEYSARAVENFYITEAMPENEQCYVCLKEVATMRCLQCSSRLYYCSTCFNSLHSRTDIFHQAEVWEVILAMFFSVIVTE